MKDDIDEHVDLLKSNFISTPAVYEMNHDVLHRGIYKTAVHVYKNPIFCCKHKKDRQTSVGPLHGNMLCI